MIKKTFNQIFENQEKANKNSINKLQQINIWKMLELTKENFRMLNKYQKIK